MLKSSQMTERLKNVDVYIAGPLFNPEENLHNFDYNLVTNSRIVVVNLNGQQINDGTSSEAAFAFTSRSILTDIQEKIASFLKENNLTEDKSNLYHQFLLNDEIFKPRVKLTLGYFNNIRSITPNFRRNPVASENIVKYALEHCPPEKK